MAEVGSSPGPIAARTYDYGFKIAVAAGCIGVTVLFWSGALSVSNETHVVVSMMLFPVYLLGAAVLLAVWLGYDTDFRDLEPVVTEPEPDESE